jgi:hypothetical protein
LDLGLLDLADCAEKLDQVLVAGGPGQLWNQRSVSTERKSSGTKTSVLVPDRAADGKALRNR